MKTVCIISDTHGSMHPSVLACIHGCDHIIHAGDIGEASIIKELEEIAPVTAVLGNCDSAFPTMNAGRRIASETIDGVVFAVVHRDTQLARDLPDVQTYYSRKSKNSLKIIGIHGHTHIPKIATGNDSKPADLIVCPGSVTSPRGGWKQTYAKIIVDKGKILSCEIRDLKDKVVFQLDL